MGGQLPVVEEQLFKLLLHMVQLLQGQFVFIFQLGQLGAALIGQLLLLGPVVLDQLITGGQIGLQTGLVQRCSGNQFTQCMDLQRQRIHLSFSATQAHHQLIGVVTHRLAFSRPALQRLAFSRQLGLQCGQLRARHDQGMEHRRLVGIRQWQGGAKHRRTPGVGHRSLQRLKDIPIHGRHPIEGLGQQGGQFGLRSRCGNLCLRCWRAHVRQAQGHQHRNGMVGIHIDQHQALPESRPLAQQLAVQRQPCIGHRHTGPHLPWRMVEPEDPGCDAVQCRIGSGQHHIGRPVDHWLAGVAAGGAKISAVVGRQTSQDDGGLLHVACSSWVGGRCGEPDSRSVPGRNQS